eukprot:TRINITY_DN17424_c0_g1_i1.p1 TRINITY_DN17424_c0_g1~~TRINITY_DN17424_c0_g1_i1.p1  ORF type:complete len:217 (+),score=94.45 TRINITY_DN17424_c0_g1_i1:42-692(+)
MDNDKLNVKKQEEEKNMLLKEITIEKQENFLLKRKLEEERSNMQASLKQLNLVRTKLKDEKETHFHLKEILNQTNLNLLKYEKKLIEEQNKNLELLNTLSKQKNGEEIKDKVNEVNKNTDNEMEKELKLEKEKSKNLELKIEELQNQLNETIQQKNNAIKQYEEEKLNVELGNLTIESLQRQLKRLREPPKIINPEAKPLQPRDELEEEFEKMLFN